jgi:hypothetical protein
MALDAILTQCGHVRNTQTIEPHEQDHRLRAEAFIIRFAECIARRQNPSEKIMHGNVTTRTTAAWTTQQSREVLADLHPYGLSFMIVIRSFRLRSIGS